ncbi:MAG: hypothetical protein VYC14_06340 [Actinomycetota bacterium]|nr:hypothetical protein [Actinomycetota bacterium]
MLKNFVVPLASSMLATGALANTEIIGSVDSKCIIISETAGVYGNPNPYQLTTAPSNGGVQPIIRYDVLVADYYKAVIEHPIAFSSSPTLDDVVTWTGDVEVSEVSDTNMADYDTNKVEYDNAHEYDLTVAGSTWFKISSAADYGYTKSFPAGQYTAVVEAECIPL